MGSHGVEAIQNLRFARMDPRWFRASQAADIKRLIAQSLKTELSRPDEEINNAVETMERRRWNLDRVVPGSVRGTRQRYANPTSVLAIDDDGRLQAYMVAALNVSTKRPSVLGLAEMEAKLRCDRLRAQQWHWVGIHALSPELTRDDEVGSDNRISVTDVMGYLTMRGVPLDRSVSAYLYKGEERWQNTLNSWGMSEDGRGWRPVHDFGAAQTTDMSRWIGENNGVGLARALIVGKPEGQEAVAHVLNRL